MIYDHLGAVQTPSVWFDSGCGAGPRARWLEDGRIEVEGQGTPVTALSKAVPQWFGEVNKAAAKYDVPAQLIVGVLATESSGNPKAQSPAAAYGLMQLLVSTASWRANRSVSAAELLNNPALNIDLGVSYMRELWDRYKGNPIKIAAGYNAGSVKCGAPGKCPTGPNQWNIITDCADGKAVDYPMRMFSFSNAALAAGVKSAGVSSQSGSGAGWLVAGLAAVAAVAVLASK